MNLLYVALVTHIWACVGVIPIRESTDSLIGLWNSTKFNETMLHKKHLFYGTYIFIAACAIFSVKPYINDVFRLYRE